jgi:NAD kinase
VPTKVGFTPLAGLNSASNVIRVGSEEVLGVATQRFDADLEPNLGPSTMGFSGEELTVVNDATDASLVATIWIGDDGRIVRVLREYSASSPDGDPISATTLYLLSNFTEPTPIEVPETADAIPAPA